MATEPCTNGHTPLPWWVVPFLTPEADDDPMGVYKVKPAHEFLTSRYFNTYAETEEEEAAVLEAIHAENRANADFIALACNSHAGLLAACEAALTRLKEYEIVNDYHHPLVRQLGRAIAKVRGQA